MFYIHKSKLLRRREVLFLHTLPTVVVFIAFLLVTLISWNTANNSIKSEQMRIVQAKNAESSASIRQRMDSYEDILRGAAGLFDASASVSREEWREYLESYDIANRYPGLQSMGYVEVIEPDSLQNHLQRVRAEGFPNYSVFPSSSRAIYTSIVYIEPFNQSNMRVFGYDLYSESVRRQAMDRARDTGLLAISDVVTLIQDGNSNNSQPGFLMFQPVYRGGKAPLTVEERRSRLKGYISAPFRSYDLMDQTLDYTDQGYSVQIYTVQPDSKRKIYESENFAAIDKQTNKQVSSTEIELSGIKWEIIGEATPEVVDSGTRQRSSSVAWGGIIFSFLIAGFIYLLLSNRSRDLAEKEERGIQAAKDELLALASHQLRTPATGVKQYVGMLREGFAGDLTEFQMQLLDKAHDSNERQLGTINEMLFVARADAGQLKLDRQEFNIRDLVSDIVEEQKGSIEQKNQTVTLKLPKKEVMIKGDKQYLRMAFENILNNAIKYTKEGGQIHVTLTSSYTDVTFRVADNGVGVPSEYRNMLFKKFSRVPNELTNKVVGSGIGLYLAKQIIDGHKGKITFESKSGTGSTVTIILPRRLVRKKKTNR